MNTWISVLLLPLVLAGGNASTSSVGKKVADFKLRDYRGAEKTLSGFADKKVVVLAFVGTECPLAKLYGPRLAALARSYESKGVAFIGINANHQDSVSDIAAYAKRHGIRFPILKDVKNVVADALNAERTPEVFVLDPERVIRYHGRIDDQHGIGYSRPKARRADLAEALNELLAGKAVSVPSTACPGCLIGRVPAPADKGEITFTKHIAPILNKHCVACHRPGEIGPFSLSKYDEVAGWTATIAEVVREGRMPPWHAGHHPGRFTNERRLADQEQKLLLDWIEAGAPEGDPKDLPPAPTFTDGWQIPKPDVILTIPRAMRIPAEGTVGYQYVAVETGFTEDKWVRAAEIRPGSRDVVHHVLVFVQPPGGSGTDRRGGFASNWLAAYVPGAKAMSFPDGLAKFVPAGSRLLFQFHYTPNGSVQTDQTSIGLVFADPTKVRQELHTEMVANTRFRIPPRTANHPVEAAWVLREDAILWALMPHTHLRGKTFKYEAVYPNGDREVLLDLPRYDFNWQNTYVFAVPRQMPKGTKLQCTATFDNSSDNPANPNPNATVRWGEQTWDEMMIGYYDMTPARQDFIATKSLRRSPAQEALPELPAELRELARGALASKESFDAFAAGVHKLLPQVDRVCVTDFDEGKLRVERSSYPGDGSHRYAETGFDVNARMAMLAGLALVNRFTVVADLKKAQGFDLRTMGQTLGSSAHVPFVNDGKPATLNFWSKKTEAFPAGQHPMLKALARSVAARPK